jgi:hypothetical protein
VFDLPTFPPTESKNLADVTQHVYKDMDSDDDEALAADMRDEIAEVQEMEGDFNAKKRQRNLNKKARGGGGKAKAARTVVQQRVMTSRDVRAEQKVRDVHFSVFPHTPSEENTGKHGGLLIVMHATTNTVVEEGKVQMAATPLDDRTIELRWHEREDRLQTLLVVQPNEDNSNADLVKSTSLFLNRVRGVFGIGYSELDAYSDDVRRGEVGVHNVIIKAAEAIDTDTNHWAVLSRLGTEQKDKMFMIPYARTVKTAVGEFGLDA